MRNDSARPVVVIVDDEPAILAAVRRALRREPYELITTARADEAIDLAGRRRVHLLVADQRMPGVYGTDILTAVHRRSPRTSLMIFTGYPDTSVIMGRINSARVRLMRKPWADEDLRAAVHQLVQGAVEAVEIPRRRPLVLCVDDEPGVLSALRRVLRWEPYRLATTDKPERALLLLERRHVSCLIADDRMPAMRGRELLLEAGRRSPGTARVMLTGYADGDLRQTCDEAGVDRFFDKPWDDDELRQAVRELVDGRDDPGWGCTLDDAPE